MLNVLFYCEVHFDAIMLYKGNWKTTAKMAEIIRHDFTDLTV
jgi:hypothetical protein